MWLFALIMPKVFTKYNAVWETELLAIGHGRTEFEAYCSSCEYYFSILSGGLNFFSFVFVVRSMDNIFFWMRKSFCWVRFSFFRSILENILVIFMRVINFLLFILHYLHIYLLYRPYSM